MSLFRWVWECLCHQVNWFVHFEKQAAPQFAGFLIEFPANVFSIPIHFISITIEMLIAFLATFKKSECNSIECKRANNKSTHPFVQWNGIYRLDNWCWADMSLHVCDQFSITISKSLPFFINHAWCKFSSMWLTLCLFFSLSRSIWMSVWVCVCVFECGESRWGRNDITWQSDNRQHCHVLQSIG